MRFNGLARLLLVLLAATLLVGVDCKRARHPSNAKKGKKRTTGNGSKTTAIETNRTCTFSQFDRRCDVDETYVLPCLVTGLGHSGTHWVAGMLAQVGGVGAQALPHERMGTMGTVCWNCAVRIGGMAGWNGKYSFRHIVQLVRYPPAHIISLNIWAHDRFFLRFMTKIFDAFPVKKSANDTKITSMDLGAFNPAILPHDLRHTFVTDPTAAPTSKMMIHFLSWNALIRSSQTTIPSLRLEDELTLGRVCESLTLPCQFNKLATKNASPLSHECGGANNKNKIAVGRTKTKGNKKVGEGVEKGPSSRRLKQTINCHVVDTKNRHKTRTDRGITPHGSWQNLTDAHPELASHVRSLAKEWGYCTSDDNQEGRLVCT